MRVPGRSVAVLVALLLAVAGCAGTGAGSDDGPVVRTTGGLVRGTADEGVQRFRGIHYARAPVGPLRWRMPEPAAPWDGTLDATASGPRCPQRGTDTGAQSEDCLVLDVTAPSDRREGERLPVVVWWHGGGFVAGSGAEYDARRLVQQGRVVVVTANYRLGVLGYLGLPGLADSGSFGFADQLQSVRWTRDNIAAFGGDPGNVTVAGQSAGGMSACALLTSPQLAALGVARVAVMSGACSLDWPQGGVSPGAPPQRPFGPVASVEDEGRAAAESIGCTGPDALACLRARPVADLLTLNSRSSRLAFGTDLLPADPATALRDRGAPVPVIYGGTRDEDRAFVRPVLRADPASLAPAAYPGLLAGAFGASAGAVAGRYPLTAYGGSAALAWSAVITDRTWACPALGDTAAMARHSPTYAYEFGTPRADRGPEEVPPGALHGADLPFLFDLDGRDVLTGDDRELADLMVAYWSSFARTGRPEAPDGPRWDPVAPGAPVRPLQLGTDGVQPVDAVDAHRCGFWDSVR